jgi:hypothetical protein
MVVPSITSFKYLQDSGDCGPWPTEILEHVTLAIFTVDFGKACFSQERYKEVLLLSFLENQMLKRFCIITFYHRAHRFGIKPKN